MCVGEFFICHQVHCALPDPCVWVGVDGGCFYMTRFLFLVVHLDVCVCERDCVCYCVCYRFHQKVVYNHLTTSYGAVSVFCVGVAASTRPGTSFWWCLSILTCDSMEREYVHI